VKIFQIGFNKCGTTSLFHLFKKNGIKSVHHSFNGVKISKVIYDNLHKGLPLLDSIDDFVFYSDMEWGQQLYAYKLFRELDNQYPESKFILNIRNVDNWLKSRLNHQRYMAKDMKRLNLTMDEVLDYWVQDFISHNESVNHYFKDKPKKLLVFDIEKDDPKNICTFLSDHFDLRCNNFPKSNYSK
jgi:hypothetical protein